MIHKITLTEMLAEYASDKECSVEEATSILASELVEDVINNRKTLDPTYEELDILYDVLSEALEELQDDANALIKEWAEDAREEYEEREEARRGQY